MTLLSLLAVVLIYPTAAREGTNLLAGANWLYSNDDPSARAFSQSFGGPFSSNDVVRGVETFRQTYGYWRAVAKVRPRRRYLTGAWLRFSNAKTLFWTHGTDCEDGRHRDYRLYQFAGFPKYLNPYVSASMTRRLAGDPQAWRLGYRYLSFDEGLQGDNLLLDVGCYTCIGSMSFAEPFLVDVTESADHSLTVEIRDSKPVARLELYRVGIRDTVWKHAFSSPVSNAKIRIPQELADCRLGQEEEKNVINGHGLSVTYADGMAETVFAPQEHAFRVITD